jgi:hypothetical protein
MDQDCGLDWALKWEAANTSWRGIHSSSTGGVFTGLRRKPWLFFGTATK